MNKNIKYSQKLFKSEKSTQPNNKTIEFKKKPIPFTKLEQVKGI